MSDLRYCAALVPLDLPADELEHVRRQKAALLLSRKWEPGETITVAFLEGDDRLKGRVKSAALEWIGDNRANLDLQFVNGRKGNIRIAFEQGAGSWSYIGTDCRNIPDPKPTMNYGWLTPNSDDDELRRVVLHEFGHALGLIHEHQNPDHPIKWNKPAVYRDLGGPPNNWSKEVIDHNMFDAYDKGDLASTAVDSKSIMMYPIPSSWTLDGFSAGLNGDLSPSDESLIFDQYR